MDYQTRQAQLQGALEDVLCEANHYVHSITEHCQGRDLAPWENWEQWLMGQFYAPLMRTQNPRWIVYGGKGDCSERAAVLQDLLISQGIPSRFIGLGGHVVLEAQNEAGNWILDPDYGVVIKTGIDELEGQSTGELSGWLIQNGIAPPESNQYEQIVRSKHDNVRLDWNEPLSPRLKRLECVLVVGWMESPPGRFVLGQNRIRRLYPVPKWGYILLIASRDICSPKGDLNAYLRRV
jgi:hypothetical protein